MKELEQNIKNQLEERRINPSVNAWEQIAQEIQKPTSKKKGFIPWMVAASAVLIGVILIKMVFLTNNISEITQSTELTMTVKEQEEKINLPEVEDQPNEVYTLKLKNTEKTETSISPKLTKLNVKPTQKATTTVYESDSPKAVNTLLTSNNERAVKPKITPENTEEIIIANTEIRKPIIENLSNQDKNSTVKKRIKINREKLLFSVENEELVKKSKKVAFVDNTLKIDLNN